MILNSNTMEQGKDGEMAILLPDVIVDMSQGFSLLFAPIQIYYLIELRWKHTHTVSHKMEMAISVSNALKLQSLHWIIKTKWNTILRWVYSTMKICVFSVKSNELVRHGFHCDPTVWWAHLTTHVRCVVSSATWATTLQQMFSVRCAIQGEQS